ncbi:MAG: flagellin [Thioalkalivibrionaceae bacterium]
MAQIINTNVLSLNAQRNLNNNTGQLGQALERLSSGLRINSAKDDAAGLAISERFSSQIRGINQAIRNANDGVSFAQTAEGALSTIGENLQRARDLAVQAANDTNSPSDRQSLQNEINQLVAEAGRIATNTQFNGNNILDGSLATQFFQIGANQGQSIGVGGVDSRNDRLGRSVATSDNAVPFNLRNEPISSIADVTISLNELASVVDSAGDPLTLNIDIAVDMTDVTTLQDGVRAINQAIQNEIAGNGNLDPADPDDAIAISRLAQANLSAALVTNNDGSQGIVIRGAFEASFEVDGGEVEFVDNTLTNVELFNGTASEQLNLTDVKVTTRFDATQALDVIDGALNQVNELRAELGAIQVRFENTILNLGVNSENLSAARSRIRDADFAAETAALTRAQILQQAGTAVLAQANASSQNVLALL